jgi:histidine decarboxylase
MSKKGCYVLGINLSVAKVKNKFTDKHSKILDEINAFDLAEVKNFNMGQINMIVVSSFSGPKGLIWGVDICKVPTRMNRYGINLKDVEVYDLDSLIDSLKRLFGTIDEPRFPLLPGSHVPCASKSIYREGPGILYSALAVGIAENRNNACLLMEDVGGLSLTENIGMQEKKIATRLTNSVLEIGNNQKYSFSKIFVGVKTIKLSKGETGCALVACPYFLLAKKAFIKGYHLKSLPLEKWEKMQNFK